MKLVTELDEIRNLSEKARCEGKVVGFVPTMGALHEGHLSLIRRARQECDLVITSIFVNPTQFGPNEDYARYPRTLESDCALAEKAGCDVVFAPEVEAIYPREPLTKVHVDKLTEGLCGRSRPGHFDGVCTVVTLLFNLVRPHKAYFGLKDYQQYVVVKRMCADLHVGVEIVPCPLVREPDGLALSSRNKYLSPEERKAALVLFRALEKAKKAHQSGETSAQNLLKLVRETLEAEPLARVDYAELVDAETLEPVQAVQRPAVLALAVYLGDTRLIDNLILD